MFKYTLPLLALLAACDPCAPQTVDVLEVTTAEGTISGASRSFAITSPAVELDASGSVTMGSIAILLSASGGGYDTDATAVRSALAGAGDLRNATQVLAAGTTFVLPTSTASDDLPSFGSLNATVAEDPSTPLTLVLAGASADGSTLSGVAPFAIGKGSASLCD